MMDYYGMEERDFATYLTYSDEDEKWQLVCVDAGFAAVPPHSPYPPMGGDHPEAYRAVATGRTVKEYQLVYITQGNGRLKASGIDDIVLGEGSVILVFPGLRHAYSPDVETGWTERWVGFKGAWADNLRKSGLISPALPLFNAGLDQKLLELFEELFEEVREQRPRYQMRSAALIMGILAHLLAKPEAGEGGGGEALLVRRSKFIMAEHIYGNISMEAIGEKLGVSQIRFYEVFKAYTGMTPYQYFIQLKINRAKELLAVDRCTVKEAAFRLGFEDPFYFSRLFKKKTGVTPSRWR
jgi:AraC-like DNA-binding protein